MSRIQQYLVSKNKKIYESTQKALALLIVFSQIVAPIGPVFNLGQVYAGNHETEPQEKVRICHRTNAGSNPYTSIKVNENAVDGDNGNQPGNQADHFGEHKGTVFNPEDHDQQTREWGDIIPPVDPHHEGLNWTEEGIAIWGNGCDIPEDKQPSVSINPIFECWEVDPQNPERYIAHFGYENETGEQQEIPYGPDNMVTPSSFESHFPTTFDYPAGDIAGREGRTNFYPDTAVQIPNWDGTNIVWNLTDQGTATASTNGPQCPVDEEPAVVELELAKSNDQDAPQFVGETITYTLIVSLPDNSGALSNVEVVDLPPEGFDVDNGSWTASTNRVGHDVVNDIESKDGPEYSSPGVWFLGTLLPGEVVTLTYTATITDEVDPGEYPDLAFATGQQFLEDSETLTYSNLHITGDDPFVDTAVQVIEDPEPAAVFTAAETVTRLPNTGPAWLDAILVPVALASMYYMFARRKWYKQIGGRI